jgi:hypothetical protein
MKMNCAPTVAAAMMQCNLFMLTLYSVQTDLEIAQTKCYNYQMNCPVLQVSPSFTE